MNKQKQFIPCDCPKGGVYSDGQVCQKCGGTEYIEQKQSEFNIVESANKIKKLIEQKQSWEERFKELWTRIEKTITGHISGRKIWCIDEEIEAGDGYLFVDETLLKFISQEIQKAYQKGIVDAVKELDELGYNKEAEKKAREEERERIIGIIKENHQGAFTDDGGNNCWYVDELIKIINK